jgi:hypothetical protein
MKRSLPQRSRESAREMKKGFGFYNISINKNINYENNEE